MFNRKMFIHTQRFSWSNLIISIVVIALYFLFFIYANTSNSFFNQHPAMFVILYWGGIALCFIIGIIWRPNFRRRHKQPEEEEEKSGWAKRSY